MRLILALLGLISVNAFAVNLNIGANGAVGDGVTDDTVNVQTSLTDCSANGKTCIVESGKNYKITGPLYMYGAANLTGADSTSTMTFAITTKYPMQIGLSSSLTGAASWTGTISGVTFRISSATVSGRLIWLAKSSGATITGNYFYPGNYQYSLTGSGVDGSFFVGAGNYVRSNITISNNVVYAESDNQGSEGIGLEGFSGATITGNTVSGVGDDLIGIHLMCTNVLIQNNDLSGVDGRIYISNSQGVTVHYNRISRMQSRRDNKWYPASSLIFVGHETAATNSNTAPKEIIISNNTITYPEGSLDTAAAIYMQGPRNTTVYNNTIYSNSSVSTGRCTYFVPFDFTGTWTDPDGLDTTPAKPRNLIFRANRCLGKYPKAMIMTGAGADHVAPEAIVDNISASTQFYSPAVVSGHLTAEPARAAATRSAATTRTAR